MFTYQINVEYQGTNFVGWQIQKNGLSVQEVLQKVLSKFLKDKKTFEGIIQSVNSEGKLVLKTTAGEQVFDVKELQFVHVADQ